MPYTPLAGGRDRLDAEYAAGEWDYLASISELPRFSILSGYCRHLRPGGAILEFGCGVGLLKERLFPGSYSRYLGVDVSDEAISRASKLQDDVSSFVAADAETYSVDPGWDLIVFSECLEYFLDPLKVLAQQEEKLDVDGFFIASLYQGGAVRNYGIEHRIRSRYTVVSEARVETQHGYHWLIIVFRPAR